MLRKSLRCVCDQATLSTMSAPKLLGLWYQSSIETQFRSLAEDKRRKDAWDRAVSVKRMHLGDDIPDVVSLAVRFLKSKLERSSCVWGVPAHALALAPLGWPGDERSVFVHCQVLLGAVVAPDEVATDMFDLQVADPYL